MRRFVLLWLLIPVAVLAQSDDIPLITPGEIINLTVTAENRAEVLYIVEDDAQYVSIQVDNASDEFDPVVWIVDSDNHLRAYNNNFADDTVSYIENLLLSPGSYTIYVDSFNGVSEGDVELTIDTSNPFNDSVLEEENVITLTINLPEDMIYRFALDVSEGEIFSVTARDISGTLDPYLTIRDSDGVILVSNDDHQSNDFSLNIFDSRIDSMQMPSTGIVFIEVHDFIGDAGQFELIIETHS